VGAEPNQDLWLDQPGEIRIVEVEKTRKKPLPTKATVKLQARSRTETRKSTSIRGESTLTADSPGLERGGCRRMKNKDTTENARNSGS
jgi:hypothetical protein